MLSRLDEDEELDDDTSIRLQSWSSQCPTWEPSVLFIVGIFTGCDSLIVESVAINFRGLSNRGAFSGCVIIRMSFWGVWYGKGDLAFGLSGIKGDF